MGTPCPFSATCYTAPMTKTPDSIARKLRSTCEDLRHRNRISAVSELVPCARTTIYRAISNPGAVSVGLADKILEAAEIDADQAV